MNTIETKALLASIERVIGLPLCLHATSGVAVPARWSRHRTAPCLAAKRRNRRLCIEFDGRRVHQELAHAPAGRIHTCPVGFTEIAVPIIRAGRQLGVLFAGPVWTRHSAPPHPTLPVIRNRAWLQDRLVLLQALAFRFAELLSGDTEDGRADRIHAFLRRNLRRPLSLDALASHLSLSTSRARHLVRELFGMSFSRLLQTLKLQQAAHLVVITDTPIGEIARQVGYDDQNYFTRLFRREFGMPPSRYRRQFNLERQSQ